MLLQNYQTSTVLHQSSLTSSFKLLTRTTGVPSPIPPLAPVAARKSVKKWIDFKGNLDRKVPNGFLYLILGLEVVISVSSANKRCLLFSWNSPGHYHVYLLNINYMMSLCGQSYLWSLQKISHWNCRYLSGICTIKVKKHFYTFRFIQCCTLKMTNWTNKILCNRSKTPNIQNRQRIVDFKLVKWFN